MLKFYSYIETVDEMLLLRVGLVYNRVESQRFLN
jgi:hypothetical protein